jgi:hypothetical protein
MSGKTTEMLNIQCKIKGMVGRLGLLFLLVNIFGCARDTVKVTGEVWRIRGNQMPSPDLPDPVYPGFSTRIYFYEPLSAGAVIPVGTGGTYRQVNGRLVGMAESNVDGRFSLRLRPGRYSVLIGRDSLFYANIRDGKGVLNPVDVPAGRKFNLQLRADWDAAY